MRSSRGHRRVVPEPPAARRHRPRSSLLLLLAHGRGSHRRARRVRLLRAVSRRRHAFGCRDQRGDGRGTTAERRIHAAARTAPCHRPAPIRRAMKLLLVDNLILPEEGSLALLDVHPHLGLLALAAAAENAGHSVAIYDPKRLIRGGALVYDATLYERVAGELLARSPDAIGFTTLGCSFLFALNIAAQLKQREPDLPILLGGPHATMLHREILERFPQFDVIARHECDEIFPDVLDNLERRSFDRIPGMSWRSADGLHFTDGKPKVDDLDTLP